MKALARRPAPVAKPAVVRVAIYTRQSVEDARSPYNSIEAQREALDRREVRIRRHHEPGRHR